MSTPSERLRTEAEARGVAQLARDVGVARNTLYNWFEKGNVPLDKLLALGEAGIDIAYVVTGHNREFRDALRRVRHAVAEADTPGDQLLKYEDLMREGEQEAELLANFRACTPPNRDTIRNLAAQLAKLK
jgi:transcriptional regulator with XRE-family HTH domain